MKNTTYFFPKGIKNSWKTNSKHSPDEKQSWLRGIFQLVPSLPTFLHGFPERLSRRSTAGKCARQRLALYNIHPGSTARKYFHHDVIAFKCEQENGSSDRTEHSSQRLFISENTSNKQKGIKSVCCDVQKCFELHLCTSQDHRIQ